MIQKPRLSNGLEKTVEDLLGRDASKQNILIDLFGASGVSGAADLVFEKAWENGRNRYKSKDSITWANTWAEMIITASDILKEKR